MKLSKLRALPNIVMLRQLVQLAVFCSLLTSAVLGEALVDKDGDRVSAKHRERRNAARSQVLPGNEQLMNILEEYDTNSVDVNLLRYTPTTPSPEDVNCYVEVPVTRRVGGRCVLLGTSQWGCQAGIFLAFSSECQNEATGTQVGSDDAATGVTPGSNRQRNPFRRRRRPT